VGVRHVRYAVRAPGGEWAGRYRVGIPARSDGARPVRDAEDGWPPLFDGSFDGALLWASASTSGAFSARVAAANPTDDRCADLAFDPCGGAIEGHWTLAAACGTADQVTGQSSYGGDDPYAGCDPLDHVEDQPFEAHGSLSFGVDGTYDTTDRFTEWGHATTTLACLDAIGWACDAPCTSDGTTCDCTWVDGEGLGAGYGGAWAYGADPGTVDLDGASLRYCVDGDSLILERLTPGSPWVPGDPYYLVYDRR
jgi:hypothetical protein